MTLEPRFLDYFWKGLLLSSFTATFFLTAIVGGYYLIKARATEMKWHLNVQLLLMALTLVGGLGLIFMGDRELMAGCFDKFAQQSSFLTATRIIAGLWLLIMGVLFCIDAVKCALIIRKTKTFKLSENKRILGVFSALKIKMGIHRSIELCSTSEAISPFAFGIIKQKIVIPESVFVSLSDQAIESALAHELIHIRDRDSVWLFIELFCRRMMFWHPLVYLVSYLHRSTLEKAADEQAVRQAHIEESHYLSALIDIASLCRTSAASPLRLAASRGFAEIKGRMESLAQVQRTRSRWYFSALIAIPLASLAVSMAEAKVFVYHTRDQIANEGLMCTQVEHEKIIEAWLRIEPKPNKCE